MAERTFIKLTFLKVDPAWQRRTDEPGAEDRRELPIGCGDHAIDRPLRACSTDGAATFRLVPAAA